MYNKVVFHIPKRLGAMIAVLLCFALVLSACGNSALNTYLNNAYEFEDNIETDDGSKAMVYRAQGTDVEQVSNQIQGWKNPVQTSPLKEERMFLVYDEELVQLMPDANSPTDTLIEVYDQKFVRNHFSMSLLETYLLVSIVDDLFDIARNRKGTGGYGGYVNNDGKYTKTVGNTGTIRFGSSNASVRGGGPGVGK
ncbi:DUF4247 domain-containing protein [Longirhabdus pacifica]|uniref:DUF4247 domain-containing protein n=1 Tax=Longirhabdus pacifica TaxID=2305227 RepID=UPI0010087ADC|nr:DUF4247 domain-containing protein [Longirhabdus pacifica]